MEKRVAANHFFGKSHWQKEFGETKIYGLKRRLLLKNLAENNLIRFTNVVRKKDAIYANFKVKGLRNGVVFSASISVDITALELHPGDTLEKIIEECARHGVKEFKKSDIQFEGLAATLSDHLGVAQLG